MDPGASEAEISLERLRELQQKELAARKAALIEQAQTALAAYDLERTREFLTQAKAEFPADPEILLMEKALDERSNARANALRLVAGAQKLFEKKKWDQGGASIQSAAESARADLLVRQKAVSAMLQAAESALLFGMAVCRGSWWAGSHSWIRRLPELTKIRASLERRKRESAIEGHLLSVQKLESAGDLNGALSQLATGVGSLIRMSRNSCSASKLSRPSCELLRKPGKREKRISEHEACRPTAAFCRRSARLARPGAARAGRISRRSALVENEECRREVNRRS